MPEVVATTVTRARTGLIGLKGYLGAIGLADSRDCRCGEGAETVKHLVLSCQHPQVREARKKAYGWRPRPWNVRHELKTRPEMLAEFLLKSGALGHIGRANRSQWALVGQH